MRARMRRVPLPVPLLRGLTAPERARLPAAWQPLLARLHDDLVALLGSECRHVERIEVEQEPDGGLRLAPVFSHGIGARNPQAISQVVQRITRATAESHALADEAGASTGADSSTSVNAG